PPYLLVHYIHMLSSYARHTLDLHSFPTRRSSDLGRDGHERARDQERTGFTGTEASQGRCRMHALIDPSLEVHDIERGQGRAITHADVGEARLARARRQFRPCPKTHRVIERVGQARVEALTAGEGIRVERRPRRAVV